MDKDLFVKKLFLNTDRLLSNTKFQKEVIRDLVRIGFIYVKEHFTHNDNKFGNMMLQMSLLKAMSIVKLSEGEVFEGVVQPDKPIIDIQSISSVYRSLFENYCYFNHLYVQNWTSEEFLILENLWKISSLNQRKNLLNKSPLLKEAENSKKIENEKRSVEKMTEEIKKTALYGKNKNAIDSIIKNNKWQLTFEENRIKSISWTALFNKTLKNNFKSDKAYQRLSLDAHPSYFSVFQFGDLYKERSDLSRVSTVLFETLQLLCNYLNDFEKLLKNKPKIAIESKYLIEILGKNIK